MVTPVALNREVGDAPHRATLLSLPSIAWRGTYALASPLIGLSLDRQSLTAAIGVTAVLGALPMLVAFGFARRRRSHMRSPAEPAHDEPNPNS